MNRLERIEGVWYTQNKELPIEQRVFFREGVGNAMTLENYREATDAEVAEWEEYKRKQEENLPN